MLYIYIVYNIYHMFIHPQLENRAENCHVPGSGVRGMPAEEHGPKTP